MRSRYFVALAAAISLSACGSSDDTPSGPISPDEAAEALAKIDTPRAGQYKATVEILEFDVPGIPQAQKDQMRSFMSGNMAQGHTYCLTQEESEAGAKDMATKLANGDCTFNDFNAGGNSLYADMTCKGENGEQGNVKLAGTMTNESSDMTMTMNQSSPQLPGGSMNMKMHLVSERIGDCPST